MSLKAALHCVGVCGGSVNLLLRSKKAVLDSLSLIPTLDLLETPLVSLIRPWELSIILCHIVLQVVGLLSVLQTALKWSHLLPEIFICE